MGPILAIRPIAAHNDVVNATRLPIIAVVSRMAVVILGAKQRVEIGGGGRVRARRSRRSNRKNASCPAGTLSTLCWHAATIIAIADPLSALLWLVCEGNTAANRWTMLLRLYSWHGQVWAGMGQKGSCAMYT